MLSDELIARMLQEEFDMEHEQEKETARTERLSGARNMSASTSFVSLNKSGSMSPAQLIGPIRKGIQSIMSLFSLSPPRAAGREDISETEIFCMEGWGQFEETYKKFMDLLMSQTGRQIVDLVKKFVTEFNGRTGDPVMACNQFAKFLLLRFHRIEQQGTCNFPKILVKECIERYLMSKVYMKAFFINEEDAQIDLKLRKKMLIHAWIEPKHLEIIDSRPMRDTVHYREAIHALQQLRKARSPIEILHHVASHARSLALWLQEESIAADDLFPHIIYSILQYNIPSLYSIHMFATRFRAAQRISGEIEYHMTSLSAAIAFIRDLSWASLAYISEDEYNQRIGVSVSSSLDDTDRSMDSGSNETIIDHVPFSISDPCMHAPDQE